MENDTDALSFHISHLLCVDLCLFLAHAIIPSELRALIKDFFCQRLTTKEIIQKAVLHWCKQQDYAELVCGNISYWDTSLTTDMESLFYE